LSAFVLVWLFLLGAFFVGCGNTDCIVGFVVFCSVLFSLVPLFLVVVVSVELAFVLAAGVGGFLGFDFFFEAQVCVSPLDKFFVV
jgi:hypothetical protein